MTPLLFLARHGQTEANRDKRILGGSGSPLTDLGRDQARAVGDLLAGAGITRVAASPLGRARETARLITAQWPRADRPEVEIMAGLAELSAGEWEGRPRSRVLKTDRLIRLDWTDRPPGGESYADGQARLKPVLAELRPSAGPVLVVGHQAVNRSLLKAWLDLDSGLALAIDQPHQVVYRLDNRGEFGWLAADGTSGSGWLMVDRVG